MISKLFNQIPSQSNTLNTEHRKSLSSGYMLWQEFRRAWKQAKVPEAKVPEAEEP